MLVSLGFFSALSTVETALFFLTLLLLGFHVDIRRVFEGGSYYNGDKEEGTKRHKETTYSFPGNAGLPRTQALKFIWAHIKQHNLHDPHDKKVIICDEKLKIFGGRGRVGFLEIAGLISHHLLK